MCGRAQPRPSPVPTPNPLNGIKLAPKQPQDGRREEGGRRRGQEGGGGASQSSGSWHSLSLHLVGAPRPVRGRKDGLVSPGCPSSLGVWGRWGFGDWEPVPALCWLL